MNPVIKTSIPEPVWTKVSGAAASSPQKLETRMRIGILTMLDNRAMGIEIINKSHFFGMETGFRYAKIDPSARNAIKERRPEQGFPTMRWPAGIVILKPSRNMGIPKRLVSQTPALAATIFKGKDIRLIKAVGIGNMKTRKMSGNHIIFVMFLPKR